jgi:hypothetical protein
MLIFEKNKSKKYGFMFHKFDGKIDDFGIFRSYGARWEQTTKFCSNYPKFYVRFIAVGYFFLNLNPRGPGLKIMKPREKYRARFKSSRIYYGSGLNLC